MRKTALICLVFSFVLCDKPTAPHDDIWGVWANSGASAMWTLTLNTNGTYSSVEGALTYSGTYTHTTTSITLDSDTYQARYVGSNDMYVIVSGTEWHLIKTQDF